MALDGEQTELFPLPSFYAAIDRLAEQYHAELHALAVHALEEIDRRIAFFHRSQAQKRRFERYRRLLVIHGDKA